MAESVQTLESTPVLLGSLASESGTESTVVTPIPRKRINDAVPETGPGSSEVEPKKQKLSPTVCFDEIYNLTDLALELSTEEKAIEFCKAWGLLPKSALCPTCGQVLTKYFAERRASAIKPFRYRFVCCRNDCGKGYKNKVPVTKNTFFQRLKISFRKAIVLIYLFSRKSTVKHAVWETSGRSFSKQTTSFETATDLFSFCRQVCLESLYNKDGKFKKIGGWNCTVEIAEAKFGKSYSIINKKKVKVDGHWAIGGICRETNDCFLWPVKDRTEDNLIEIVVERVKRGTTVISDCFTPSRLQEKGFEHLMANETPIGSTLGGIRLIKSTWGAVKQAIPKSVSNHKHFNLGAHLAEYVWRKQQKNKEHHFVYLLEDIAKLFPGPDA